MRPLTLIIRHLIWLSAPLIFDLAAAPRASAIVDLPNDFSTEVVVSRLDQPVGLAFFPDNRLLVIELGTGAVHLIVSDQIVTPPLTVIPDLKADSGDNGLLGVAVDPDWPGRPYVYLMFTRMPGNVMRIVRFTTGGDLTDRFSPNITLSNRVDIMSDIPDLMPTHNAGTLRFGPDGMLYASLGDDADPCSAADSTQFRGVILRLDVAWIPENVSGNISKRHLRPGGNPFPNSNENLALTYCFGLRNPFRFQIDAMTGRLYISDVGDHIYEEIDEATGGENFGWPFREGPSIQTPAGCTEPGGPGGSSYDPPIASYDRTGFTASSLCVGVYRRALAGKYAFPLSHEGSLFYSDHYQGFIRRLVRSGSTWVPAAPILGQPSVENWGIGFAGVTDWQQAPDGALYYANLWNGTVGRITYRRVPTPPPPPPLPEQGLLPDGLAAIPTGANAVSIRFDLDRETPARIAIFNVLGRVVARIADATLSAGPHEFIWDEKDDAGRPVSRGLYFARIETSAGKRTARVMIGGR